MTPRILREKLNAFLKDDLVVHSGIVFISLGLGSFFQFLYHLVAVRLLSAEDYGTFNALASFMLIFSLAGSPLHMTFVRYFTEYIAKGRNKALSLLFSLATRRMIFFLVALFLAIILAAPFMAHFLTIHTGHILLCAGVIIVSLLTVPFLSLVQSFQEFNTISAIWGFSSLMKLLAGAVLMLAGLRVAGGLIGYLAGPACALFFAVMSASRLLSNKKEVMVKTEEDQTVSLTPLYAFAIPAFITMLSFALLTNIDIVIVKHFFSALMAGYYSIAQIGAKIALLLPFSLALALSPKSTQAYVNKKNSLKLLYKSLVLGTACGGLLSGAAFLFPKKILLFLSGNPHPISCSLLGIFVLAMSFYALLWIAIHYALAVHNFSFIASLFMLSIAEFFSMYLYHDSLLQIVLILLGFSVVSFSLVTAIIVFQTRRADAAPKPLQHP